MLKIIKHINLNRMQKPTIYNIQSVPTEEVTLRELDDYAENKNINVQFIADETHIIQRVQ